MIDFNGLPDGTLVSAGNPYAGMVILQAHAESNDITGTYSQEGVEGGVLAVIPADHGENAFYSSLMDVSFILPAADVSFDGAAYRHPAFTYTAQNPSGDIFNAPWSRTGTGGIEDIDGFHHIVLAPPQGYHVTYLVMGSLDPGPWDAPFWIDNLSFNVVTTPDQVDSWVLFALACIGLTAVKRFA